MNKKITAAAWKLTRRFKGAELEDVEARLNFYVYNALHHTPYDASRGISEDAYNGIMLTNAGHRVIRELAREARMRARTSSLDAMLERGEVCDD